MKVLKNIQKAVFLLLIIFVTFTFTACKGNKISRDLVSITFDKHLNSLNIVNDLDDNIYVKLNIVILDKYGIAIFEKKSVNKYIPKESMLPIFLEDIKPEWLEYDRIYSMDAKVVEVYDSDCTKYVVNLMFFLVFVIVCIFSINIITKKYGGTKR